MGYEFTANLEEELDDVSAGNREYLDVLDRFWRDFSAAIGETADLRIGEVLDKINEVWIDNIIKADRKFLEDVSIELSKKQGKHSQ